MNKALEPEAGWGREPCTKSLRAPAEVQTAPGLWEDQGRAQHTVGVHGSGCGGAAGAATHPSPGPEARRVTRSPRGSRALAGRGARRQWPSLPYRPQPRKHSPEFPSCLSGQLRHGGVTPGGPSTPAPGDLGSQSWCQPAAWSWASQLTLGASVTASVKWREGRKLELRVFVASKS